MQALISAQNQRNQLRAVNKIEGYEILIYEFQQSFCCNQAEYKIEYNNEDLPFEIEKLTGKVFYLLSEDTIEYSLNGDKFFNLIINILNPSEVKQFMLQIQLVNNDPLIQLDNLVNVFHFNPSKPLIGQIFSDHFDLSAKKLKFQLAQTENFDVEATTGHLFIKSLSNECNFKLNVNATGYTGEKRTLLKFDVFLYNSNCYQTIAFDKTHFDLKIEASDGKFEAEFKLSAQYSIVNANNRPARFRLIGNELEQFCQLNWFNAILSCYFHEAFLFEYTQRVFNLVGIAYGHANEAEYATIKIHVFEKHFKTRNEIHEQPKQLFLIHRIEDLAKSDSFNLFSLLKDAYINIDLSQARIYFNSNKKPEFRMSSFFDLNPYDGQLTMKKHLRRQISEGFSLEQEFKLICLNDAEDLTQKIVKLNLEIDDVLSTTSQSLFSVNYEDLIEKSSKTLYKFGQANSQREQPKHKFYLEVTRTLIQQTKSYDLILANTINLSNNLNSMIYVDVKNGDLFLNRSLFLELNLIEYKFIILEYDDGEKKLLNRVHTKLSLQFDHYANLIEYYLDFKHNLLIVDRFIDLNSAKIGDVLFRIADMFSDFFRLDNFNEMKIETADDVQLPIRLDPINGCLLIADKLTHNHDYSFSLNLVQTFKIYFRFRTKNDSIQFERSFYSINLDENSFSNNGGSSVLKLSASFLNQSRVKYRFSEPLNHTARTYTLVSYFKSMLSLNELTGEIRVNTSARIKFQMFCGSFENLEIPNLILSVKAFSQVNYQNTVFKLIQI